MLSEVNDSNSPTARQIILFTNGYPYGAGEEFLESEIRYLAQRFVQVFVVPLADPASFTSIRPLPERAEVIHPRYESSSNPHILFDFMRKHPLITLRALKEVGSTWLDLRRGVDELKFFLMCEIITNRTIDQLRSRLNRSIPAVFYSYWLQAPAQVAITTRRKLKLLSAPLVSRAHGYDLYTIPEARRFPPAHRQMLRRLTSIFPISEHGAAHLAYTFPAFAGKIFVSRLGVDKAKKQGNPSLQERVIYSCSSLVPLKRLPLLIESLQVLQERNCPMRWVHIGDGTYDERIALRELARQTLAPGSFTFTGSLPNHEVRKLYADNPGSVFVNVSSSEGAPVAIMEALAQGMPVIATDVGGSSELIDTSLGMFNGLLPADPSPNEVADYLERLLDCSSTEYAGYVEASITHWKKNWSAKGNFSSFCTALEKL